jgi:endonuclease/exonuclease/phosphatase family metal-dependent hydrolase
MEISVLTLSTSACRGDYRARLDLMVRETAALAPDIILLQDVFATADGRYNTAAMMARCLGMAAAFHPARPAERHLDGRAIECHTGLAVLGRTAIRGSMRIELPSDADGGERIAQIAELDIDGCEILVVNLQLSACAEAGTLRQSQLDALAGVIDDAHYFEHIILGGDFGTADQPFPRSSNFVPAGAHLGRDRVVMLDRLAAPCSRLHARPALERRDTVSGLNVADRPAVLATLRLGLARVRPLLIQAAE